MQLEERIIGLHFYEFSLKSYYDWLNININEARNKFKKNERFMFINAWNEWAEGTYLEPDKKYGYSYLNTTSKALMDLPLKMI
jgi:lipopolysaccharide biosynthesis protein